MEELLAQAAAAPDDVELRLVLADALEEAGDTLAAAFVRQDLALTFLAPDHPARLDAEAELSTLRRLLPADRLPLLEPRRSRCPCYRGEPPSLERLHDERQDTEAPAWRRLEEEIRAASDDGGELFAPLRPYRRDHWLQIVTVPPSIGELLHVRALDLNGAQLFRLPPELGNLRHLEYLRLSSSRGLHWLPFELTRCTRLIGLEGPPRSYDAARPRLVPDRPPPGLPGWHARERLCSVCETAYVDEQRHRDFVARRLGGHDVVLLVNACSAGCLEAARR
jgi:uncharacterized protein (TIGR02996 family)